MRTAVLSSANISLPTATTSQQEKDYEIFSLRTATASRQTDLSLKNERVIGEKFEIFVIIKE